MLCKTRRWSYLRQVLMQLLRVLEIEILHFRFRFLEFFEPLIFIYKICYTIAGTRLILKFARVVSISLTTLDVTQSGLVGWRRQSFLALVLVLNLVVLIVLLGLEKIQGVLNSLGFHQSCVISPKHLRSKSWHYCRAWIWTSTQATCSKHSLRILLELINLLLLSHLIHWLHEDALEKMKMRRCLHCWDLERYQEMRDRECCWRRHQRQKIL